MRCALALVLVAGLAPCATAATIILVRHAERAGGMAADVPLSPQGEARARKLAEMLKDAGIRAIFTTEVKRTQQTAEPTAQEFHLQPVVIPQKDMDALVSRLRALPDDGAVLVVGHSPTVPAVVEALGGSVPVLGDAEYDRMVIVITRGKEKPTVITLRYGEAAH